MVLTFVRIRLTIYLEKILHGLPLTTETLSINSIF